MLVLITGHTGFKGAWLTLLLREAGHTVCGLALDPQPGSLFERAGIADLLEADLRCDIRDSATTIDVVRALQPDAVIHLAAQPLVRASYAQPRYTVETNVMGTLAVLEAVAVTESVRAALMVTTDKVYRNVNSAQGYREGDPLGGHDPYSASKAMADILVSSWVDSFNGPPIAVARAGNVIGGGDVSPDRLLPDLVRSFSAGEPALIRNPSAVRPWQHVLDCLAGYERLLQALLAGGGTGAWNFGPDAEGLRTVADAATLSAAAWGDGAEWARDRTAHPHEAQLLTLDSTRAHEELGWSDRLHFEESIGWTIGWEKQVRAGGDARALCMEQIAEFRSRKDAQP